MWFTTAMDDPENRVLFFKNFFVGKIIVALTVAGLIWFCSSPSLFADPLSSKPVYNDPFQKAEIYFHAGDFEKARQLYQDYYNRHASGARSYRALFRLGQLDHKRGSFATALRYYQILIKEFPRSSVMNTVIYFMGECYFELGQNSEAERFFRKVVSTHPDIKWRWKALFYLGKLDERKFDFVNALDKLVQVFEQKQNNTVLGFARQEIETLIAEKLSEENLLSLTGKYQTGFPADLIFLKLISFYRSHGNIDKFKSVAVDFSRRFPEHPEREKIERQIQSIDKNEKGKVRLGVILPLTGKRAVVGQQVLQGIQLALNQQGALGKQKVELVVRDSATGVSLTRIMDDLAGDPTVAGILGPVLSDEVKEIVPLVDKYQISVFTPTASSEGLAEMSPYIFRNALTRKIQARFLADYAVNELNLNRFAILYPVESYGIEFRKMFKREVESLGGQVVTTVAYDRTQTDFRPQILELGGITDDKLEKLILQNNFNEGETPGFGGQEGLSRPVVDMGHWNNDKIENLKASLELKYDAIFIPGFFDKVGLIVPQLVFYNIDNVTLLGGSGWNSPKLIESAGSYIRDGLFVDGFFKDSSRPEVKKFVAAFKSTFGKEPTLHSAQAYDGANIMIESVLNGADNRIAVKEHLSALQNYPGVSGKTTLLPGGDSDKELFTLRIKNRKVKQIN
jgi:ABC-type branched-subunit amino acid transport system substrate-binding protein/TolA-binding protein